jgi:hypothetical protein
MANVKSFVRVATRVAKSKAKFFTPSNVPPEMADDELPSDDELIEEAFETPAEDESEITYDGVDSVEGVIDFDMGIESDGLSIPTEYSCRMQIDMTATFEGTVSKADLIGKIKEHLKTALKSGMQKAAGEMSLQSTDVKVMPIQMDVAVLDGSEAGMDFPSPGGEVDEEDLDESGTDYELGDEGSEGADYGDPDDGSSGEDDDDEDEGSSAASEAADDTSASAEED